MSFIQVKNLYKEYKQGTKTINAANGINLEVKKGDFLVIIGSSGCGKSTLLQLIGGLDRPTSGEVILNEINIIKIGDARIARIRRDHIGFIFQNFNLIPTLTAVQNVEAAIAKRGKNDHKKALKVLEMVGLKSRANHLPNKLSGGEQQRVAIARALINNPEIILADEPTGNLDSKTGKEILDIIHDLNKKNHQTIIMVTHSEYAEHYATKLIKMKDGKII